MSDENTQQLAVQQPKPEKLIVSDNSSISHVLDTARFEQTFRFAKAMAMGSLIPEHLKGKTPEEAIGNCLLVVNQSIRWEFDPFAVAGCTFVIKGKLGFEGKLVAAVVNSKSPFGKLRHVFNSKTGDAFAIVVYAATQAVTPEQRKKLVSLAETNDRTLLSDLEADDIYAVRLDVSQAKTDNQMWRNDPEQKLVYSGAARWARRHQPGLMLGVITDDDKEKIANEELPKAIMGRESIPTPGTATAAAEVLQSQPPAEKKSAFRRSAPKPEPPPTDPAPGGPEPTPEAEKKAAQAELPKSKPAGVVAQITAKLAEAGFDDALLLQTAKEFGLCAKTITTLAEIPERKLQDILDDFDTAADHMAKLKAAQ